MKNILKSLALLAAFALMLSCQSGRQKALDNVKLVESETFAENGMIDQGQVDALIAVYEGFANDFPKDTLAPDYLFKAGDVAMNSNRSNQAILLYDRIINEYGDYKKAPEALFLKGYVYENNLGRLDKAKAIYEEFLAKYPDNDFADDAEVSLRFLGKSPEELIQIFQSQAEQEQE